jgi:hypothetical protein
MAEEREGMEGGWKEEEGTKCETLDDTRCKNQSTKTDSQPEQTPKTRIL